MTLAQIMKLALRQLDEDIEDISEHDELFRAYANMGNQIIMKSYYQPREIVMLRSDENGRLYYAGMGIRRVLSLTDAYGRTHPFRVSPDAEFLEVAAADTEMSAVCEMEVKRLVRDDDEPDFPEEEHFALADYICYRKLSAGNAAKQSRAQFFYASFMQAAQRLRPQADGRVTGMRNLYAASSIHAKR